MAAFLNLHGKSKPAKLTSFYRRTPNAAGGLYLRCQDDMPNTFAWVICIHPYIHPVNEMWIFGYLCVRPLSSQPIFFRVYRRTSLMNSSLTSPAVSHMSCFSNLDGFQDRPYSCFVGCCQQDLLNIALSILVQLPSSVFFISLVSIYELHLYNSIGHNSCLEKIVLFYQIGLTFIWSITY